MTALIFRWLGCRPPSYGYLGSLAPLRLAPGPAQINSLSYYIIDAWFSVGSSLLLLWLPFSIRKFLHSTTTTFICAEPPCLLEDSWRPARVGGLSVPFHRSLTFECGLSSGHCSRYHKKKINPINPPRDAFPLALQALIVQSTRVSLRVDAF